MSSEQQARKQASAPVVVWGLAGIVAILFSAVSRLYPKVEAAMNWDLTPMHWGFAVWWTVFMLYSEVYRGFYLRFSPCAVARAWHLGRHPRALHVVLAPLFCMGFFHGSRRRLVKSWVLSCLIVCFVLIAHSIPQPWRGLVDLGVVLGLIGGAGTVLWEAVRALRLGPQGDPELPVR